MDVTSRGEQRAARRQKRAASPILTLPFRALRNPWRPIELLRTGQIEKLHTASMRILSQDGLVFEDDGALDLWAQAGARVDHGAGRAWMEPELVTVLMATAPATFTWQARNPDRSLEIGGDGIAFGPGGGTAFVSDLERGRRPANLRDYENLVRLAQICGVLHFASSQPATLHDVPEAIGHLQRLQVAFSLSDKAVMDAARGREMAEDNLAMARIVFGELATAGPVIGAVIEPETPFGFEADTLGGLIAFAGAGQVCCLKPASFTKTKSAHAWAEALAQQNAQSLAGVALAQIVRPGAPVIYGGFSAPGHSAGPATVAIPDGALAAVVGAQMARHYKLPHWSNSSATTSKAADGQAASETQSGLWPSVMAHTNLSMASVGALEGGLTASIEQFIIDVESLAMFQHMLGGFVIDADTLALDMIREVGPGGHHFGTSHTQARFSTEFYETFLADRQGYENWLAAGALDTAQRAHRLWKELLAQYEPPPLDPAISDGVADFVARRTRELVGRDLAAE